MRLKGLFKSINVTTKCYLKISKVFSGAFELEYLYGPPMNFPLTKLLCHQRELSWVMRSEGNPLGRLWNVMDIWRQSLEGPREKKGHGRTAQHDQSYVTSLQSLNSLLHMETRQSSFRKSERKMAWPCQLTYKLMCRIRLLISFQRSRKKAHKMGF